MSIPCKMRPAGLDSLPMGYTRVDFLEANKRQHINTGVMPTGDMNIKVDVMATKWVYVNYVFGSAQVSGPNIVFSMDYANAHGRAGLYRYGKQSTFFPYGTHRLNKRYHYEFDGPVVYRDGELARFMNSVKFTPETFTGTSPILLFISRHDNWHFYDDGTKRIWKFSIDRPSGPVLNYIPALDPAGVPCMFDTVTRQPFYNAASTGAFIAGMTLGQALKLKDLPAKTATLDISLPEGYDSQEEVMESIQQAEEKGWTFNITTHTPA